MSEHHPRDRRQELIPRVSAEQLEQIAKYPAATLHEAAGRTGALPSGIKPVAPAFRAAGPAVTVATAPGDNLWIHRAIDAAAPGDVLVVHTGGAHEWGYWGELMSVAARRLGLGGLVIDGCARDGERLARLGFPVFARGLCIRGTAKASSALGALNEAVQIGEVTVHPGDLVVGDGDGVLVLPRASVEAILRAAAAREAKEATILERIEAGERTLDIYGWR
jgi:4-hydroxy-4-methyl-2-oxoglutarate aldolase